jgi:hypothetical protein
MTNLLARCCIIVLWTATTLTTASAQDRWKLVYENDANGKAVQGNLGDLVEAIRAGKEVRIYFRMGRPDTPQTFAEHTTSVMFASIFNSPEGIFVTGQTTPIVGQTPDFKKQHVTLKENLEWSLIASTTGQNDHLTRNMVTGEIIFHGTGQWGTQWWVAE